MKIPLDRQITQSIYLQIRKVRRLILFGVLQPSDRLSSVRQMARDQVNKLTVVEATPQLFPRLPGLCHYAPQFLPTHRGN